ncbi:glycerol kinase GlpK [candidate division KSB1 bacterium]|nr:glycerol kinase GlpK [candidate division KSB1 bacterium]
MSKYIGAIDQGTTSTRFMIFDHGGHVVSVSQKEHEQIFPHPGWVEHDAKQIWKNTESVILDALKQKNLTGGDLAAIGITNQRETSVIWDKTTGEPLYNAIVWQDTRTDDICNQLAKKGGPERFRSQTGLPLATYFSGPKIKWMINNVPAVNGAVNRGTALFGNMDTWVLWNLTGGVQGGLHLTDVTNASRTLLMNLQTLDWDEDILGVIGVPKALLPQIQASSEVYGATSEKGLLKTKIPIAGILGDQQAALVGQTCFEVGEAKNTYGTGCFMLLNTGEAPVLSKNGLITTVGYKFGDNKPVYALEGSVAIAGALVQWLRDNLGLIDSSAEIEDLAQTVKDNGGIYFVPAFSGLYAPYWESKARGIIIGLTRYINKGHIARAVLEATAYQTREILDAMNKDSGVKLIRLKVDGGMVVNELLMQFQADVLGVPVVRPTVNETTALGAAYAAGLAVGFWRDYNDLRNNWNPGKEWQPDLNSSAKISGYNNWLKAVKRTFDWLD